MGQVRRICFSSLLVTSLGCASMPAQLKPQSKVPLAATYVAPMPSLTVPTILPEGWALDEHGESATLTVSAPEAEMPMEESEAFADPVSSALSPRLLRLFDLHDRTLLEVTVSSDGQVAEEERAQLEYFFRCRRTEQTHTMAGGVLKILYAIDAKYPGHVIEIVSGFRTYPYGVRESKHYEGHAIDLRVRGVATSRVRDFVWAHFADVGVGYYGHQNFVHVDHRPEEKDTAWTSPAPNAAYAYNPWWALRLRAPWRAPRAL